jgi:Ca2+/H+ antiporter, TMEM165/GDT1 family
MHLGIIALVFGVVFIAELPDKSLFASLILGNRYPKGWVWLGAASAFLVHVIIAVAAARLLILLPHRWLELVIGLLFAAGAGMLILGKHGLEEPPHPHLRQKELHSFRKVFGTAFGVIFIGEWGDITQITTANYAARYHDPFSVALGAVLGLWTVTALAIFVGTKTLGLIPQIILQRLTASILVIFAILSFISALK